MAGMKLLFALLLVAPAWADTPPVPKVFKGIEGQKGQYQVDVLDGGGKSSPQKMTICTDNVLNRQADGKARKGGQSNCKYRLLKDTADEAVIETTCDNRTSTVTMKRESAKSMLMTMDSTGQRGEQHMKMRYTHLGPCREGQGTVTLDKNSEQCKKMREQAAKMDPAKQCERQKSDREACESRMRDAVAQMKAMCS